MGLPKLDRRARACKRAREVVGRAGRADNYPKFLTSVFLGDRDAEVCGAQDEPQRPMRGCQPIGNRLCSTRRKKWFSRPTPFWWFDPSPIKRNHEAIQMTYFLLSASDERVWATKGSHRLPQFLHGCKTNGKQAIRPECQRGEIRFLPSHPCPLGSPSRDAEKRQVVTRDGKRNSIRPSARSLSVRSTNRDGKGKIVIHALSTSGG